MIRKSMLNRLGGVDPKKTNRTPSPAELLRGLPPSYLAQKELDRRAAEAKAAAEQATSPPEPSPASPEAKAEPTDARPVDPQPPAAPQTPPPEKPWYEEMVRWRPRDAPNSHEYDDGDGMEYCETIHRYDPLERALEEDDYDFDR